MQPEAAASAGKAVCAVAPTSGSGYNAPSGNNRVASTLRTGQPPSTLAKGNNIYQAGRAQTCQRTCIFKARETVYRAGVGGWVMLVHINTILGVV